VTNEAKLNIQHLSLTDLIPHPENPRSHTEEQIQAIADNIVRHGFAAGTLVIQASTSYIIKGNGVCRALLSLAYTSADVVVKDMTDEEALLFMISDNKLSDMSEWDVPQLEANFETLEDAQVDLEETSFTLDEIRDLGEEDKRDSQSDDSWVSYHFRVPIGVRDIVDSELDRIGEVLNFGEGLSDAIKRGLILEAVCMNSANTPIESLR